MQDGNTIMEMLKVGSDKKTLGHSGVVCNAKSFGMPKNCWKAWLKFNFMLILFILLSIRPS